MQSSCKRLTPRRFRPALRRVKRSRLLLIQQSLKSAQKRGTKQKLARYWPTPKFGTRRTVSFASGNTLKVRTKNLKVSRGGKEIFPNLWASLCAFISVSKIKIKVIWPATLVSVICDSQNHPGRKL